MVNRIVRKLVRSTKYYMSKRYITRNVHRKYNEQIESCSSELFNFDNFKKNILNFINTHMVDSTHYYYSKSSTKPTLYASSYVCMLHSLLGEINTDFDGLKLTWRNSFDSYQKKDDGLFYDAEVANEFYNNSDWWGARHLAVHVAGAYVDINKKPMYHFSLVKKYCNRGYIQAWLNEYDWNGIQFGDTDIDNKIMNIGCLLQYQRDFFNDAEAGNAVEVLKAYLKSKINKTTQLWGGFDPEIPTQRSKMIQFAYHLLTIFFYDNDFDFSYNEIVEHTLNTQNSMGGFGVTINSSACEDIDSIYLLTKFAPFVPSEMKLKIDASIKRAFKWVLLNQVEDGGFVFRLYDPFVYGDAQTSSIENQGAMFPTWFRTLSIAYMAKYLKLNHGFKVNRSPGYEN